MRNSVNCSKVLLLLTILFNNVPVVFSQNQKTDPHVELIKELISEVYSSENKGEPLIVQLDYFNSALSDVEELSSVHEARAVLYFHYTRFLSKLGYYDEALKYGLELISIIENEHYHGEYFHIYSDVGKIYLKLGEYDKAISIEKAGLERRIRLADQIDPKKLYHFLFNEMGLTYFRAGDYDNAIHYYERALYSDFPFNNHFKFVLEENIAEALVKKGDHVRAKKTIEGLRTHPGRYENDRRNINYYLLQAEYYLLENRLVPVSNYLDSAYSYLIVSSEKEEPGIWWRYMNNLHKYYILKGDQPTLAKFEIGLNKFEDSLNLISNRSIIITRNAHFDQILENQKLRLENEQLESDKSKALLREEELNNRSKTLFLILVALSLALTIFILFRVYKNYKKRSLEKINLEMELGKTINANDKLAESIKDKESDIQTLSNYLLGSSEQIKKLKDILKRINKIEDPDEKEAILLSFLVDSRKKILHLEDNSTMLKNIEAINHEFQNRLLKKHPKLTKGELVYCGLIKAGFSNTSIAHELNTSVNSVKTSKYRLKKKLELTSDENIETYLRQI